MTLEQLKTAVLALSPDDFRKLRDRIVEAQFAKKNSHPKSRAEVAPVHKTKTKLK